jgi:hypothetical protein
MRSARGSIPREGFDSRLSAPTTPSERGLPSPCAPCEHLFVSIKGGPYARFRRALDSGNLTLIRSAAAELPHVSLEDALRVCLAVRKSEPETYERAVVRWLGRFCLERRDVTLAAVRVATEALERLPRAPDESLATLRWLVGR